MKKVLLAALGITIALGAGATAYASTDNASQPQRLELGRKISLNRWEMRNAVLERLGITQEDFTQGKEAGKSLLEIAKDKGIEEDAFKKMMLEEKSKLIDKAVEEGKITKEEADTYKENLKDNISSCNGQFRRQNSPKGTNESGRRMGSGMRNGSGKGHGRWGNDIK